MNSSAKAFNKLPGVLSFQRGLVISDGEFFNEIDGSFEDHPVPVVQHGIRGTQNVNPGNGAENGERTAKGAERAVSNIQTTETAKLAPQASALVVRFRLRMIDLKHALYACASDSKAVSAAALREAVQQFIHRAKGGDGLDEVARRFARNIANGRWLWRNRVIADAITIKVKSADQEVAIFDALDIPLNRFENYSDGEQRLARALAKQMRGTSIDSVEVLARLTFGVRGT